MMGSRALPKGSIDARYQSEPAQKVREGPLTFDDIPPWCTAYYDDDIWWVNRKGDDITTADGRHIQLRSQTSESVAIIHEGFINLWLLQREKIHFNIWELAE